MIIDTILDVSSAKTLDEVIDAQVDYEISTCRMPERFLFDSKEQLKMMWREVSITIFKPLLCGIRIIFKQDIKKWQEYRKVAHPNEFWVKYWTTDLDELGFDPLSV